MEYINNYNKKLSINFPYRQLHGGYCGAMKSYAFLDNSFLYNDVSHWLGASLESTLYSIRH